MHDTLSPAEILAGTAKRLLEAGRPDLARTLAGLAVGEHAGCANAHSVLGVACGELGEWWAGLEHARRAAALLPTSAQLQYNLALTLLRLGEYREGFALMEARLDKPDWTGFATAPSRAAERRRLLRKDEPVEGRQILVIVEQGLGDCIMFARYVPRLAERGAHVTVACSPPLRPVFERIGGVVELLSPPPDQPLAKINLTRAEFDAWVPLLSLPFLFAAELASVPAEIPYLTAAPPRVAAWRERFASAGGRGNLKIGLVFHANPASGSVLDRSIPIADLAPLFSLEGFDWVNLQGGAAGRRLMAEQPQAIDATKPDLPLDEFAAAVAATDLIVSVDTMAAHCAGALGHEAWLTIPFSPHWCWGIAGERTPWYPTTRLFRQSARHNWRGVVDSAARRLQERRAKLVAGSRR